MSRPPFSPDDSARDADPIAAAAADWVVRRDRGLTEAEAQEFAAWQAADPRHAAELARQDGAWRSLDSIGASPDLARLADDVFERARERRRRRRMGFTVLAAAAALALTCALFFRFAGESDDPAAVVTAKPTSIQVLAATAHQKFLPDGTVVELNGDSVIETDFTTNERRVRLVRGEAHFFVRKNPARPFLVTVGQVTVRAVGTAFNVRLGGDKVEVLVTEGKVRLDGAALAPVASSSAREEAAAPALTVGQRAQIASPIGDALPAVSIGLLKPAEVDEALGWQAMRLMFDRTPLEDVVAAFNSHNIRQFVIADPALRSLTLTGTFRADNAHAFGRLLEASIGVRAEPRAGDVIALVPAR
jgi:transmembrane sensor